MGQSVSQVKEQAKKDSAEAEKQANDALNALLEMAKNNLKLFETQVEENADLHHVQINKILKSAKLIKCSVETNTKNIQNEVKGLLGDIANGHFLSAISGVVGTGLDVLFGNYSGNTSEVTSSTVSVGVLGNFSKVDYYMYSYQYTSQALLKVAKNVVCVAVVVSSVKVDTLDKTDVDNLLVLSFGGMELDKLHQLQDDCYAALGWAPVKRAKRRIQDDEDEDFWFKGE